MYSGGSPDVSTVIISQQNGSEGRGVKTTSWILDWGKVSVRMRRAALRVRAEAEIKLRTTRAVAPRLRSILLVLGILSMIPSSPMLQTISGTESFQGMKPEKSASP